jgi:hypothetical protein
MEHRGVRYAIRIGIARCQWQVAVYLPDKELPKETTVVGTRRDAEIAASSIIDAWMKQRFREISECASRDTRGRRGLGPLIQKVQ